VTTERIERTKQKYLLVPLQNFPQYHYHSEHQTHTKNSALIRHKALGSDLLSYTVMSSLLRMLQLIELQQNHLA